MSNSKPDYNEPDWGNYAGSSEVELWQAVALSLGVPPSRAALRRIDQGDPRFGKFEERREAIMAQGSGVVIREIPPATAPGSLGYNWVTREPRVRVAQATAARYMVRLGDIVAFAIA